MAEDKNRSDEARESGRGLSHSAASDDTAKAANRDDSVNRQAQTEDLQSRIFDTVLGSILDLVYVFDKDGRFLYANRRLLDLLGIPLEEIIGKNFFDLPYPTELAARLQRQIEQVIRERQIVRDETAFRSPSGRNGFYEYIFTPVFSAEGAVEMVAGSTRDITERRQAQEALQVKSDEVISILESVTEAFFALDGEWRFTYVNNAAERLLSRKREALVGRSLWEEFPAAVGSDFETHYVRAARERVTVTFRAFYPPPLDSWYDVRAYPARTGGGISVYFRNVNEEHRREEERERLHAEQKRLVAELERANARQRSSLQQSEERFRLLVEGVRDYAIFMLDTEGHIATWNAGAERFKGYKADEIIGQHFSRFYTDDDIARRHPWTELTIASREGRYEEEGWRVRKDGSRFWASVVITALRDKKGVLQGFAKVTRDVTERRLSEQARSATQVLRQQRRFLKEVLASVTQGRLLLCDAPSDLPLPLPNVSAGEAIWLSKQAIKALRSRVGEAAIRYRLPLDRTQDLVTAVSECAMNSVQHAGGGMARVYGDDTGRVQVWIEDSGKGIDLSSLPRATLEPGFSTGGGGIGHGFSLMIACCQRVYLLTGPNGTTVVLEQDRIAPEPAWLASMPLTL